MPQNALLGWHFAWPKFLTGRNAGKQAVNKDYVDQSIADAGLGGLGLQALRGLYINTRGDAMKGPLLLADDPTDPLGAATKHYVDAVDNLKLNTWDPVDGGVY